MNKFPLTAAAALILGIGTAATADISTSPAFSPEVTSQAGTQVAENTKKKVRAHENKKGQRVIGTPEHSQNKKISNEKSQPYLKKKNAPSLDPSEKLGISHIEMP